MKLKTSTTLAALASLGLTAISTDAAVLLGGFDGTNNAGPAIQDASVAGQVTVTLAVTAANLSSRNFADVSGLWGTTDFNPDPSTATGTDTGVVQDETWTLALTVANNSVFDLTLEQLHINVRIDNPASDILHDVTYVSGDLAETDGTLITQVPTGPAPNFNMVGYSTSLAGGGITDLTLASGESATISYSVTNTNGSAWVRADNFAISGSIVPEPSTTALLGLGGLALVFRRRK